MTMQSIKSKMSGKILTFAVAIIFFLILAYAFVPQVLGGKIVNQSDFSGWRGMAQETMKHNEAHPEDPTYWTNSMFGGMPNVTMYDDFKGDWTKPIYDILLSGARPANYLFISLVGSFLLMIAMGVNWLLAIGGAVAITFCSYNLQIIQVGHNTKMQAIAFMPWVLAALVFTYQSVLRADDRKKMFINASLGASMFALALSFQIKANHPQITYYLAIVIFIYAIVVFAHLILKEKQKLGRFFTASAMLLVIGCFGIATNLNKLIPTYEYTEYTMRGGSELAPEKESDNSKGLDLDYATAWSYGIEETPNLLIPFFNGGASAGEITLKDSKTRELLERAGQPNLDQIMKNMPLYWGPQPFTAGPMYIGAISIFLFVLGLCLYDRKEKWWLLAATVLAILLAWGNHFMWFTKLWFDYAPMYNKFRTVSMALVILQFTVPMLGFLTLDRILKGKYSYKKVCNGLLAAFLVTGGFCMLFWFFPGLAGTFSGASDAGMNGMLADALAEDRRAMLSKSASQSYWWILFATAIIFWAAYTHHKHASDEKKWIKVALISSASVSLLVMINMMGEGKRYLNDDDFVGKRSFAEQFSLRPVDKEILKDKSPDYRVLDISVNTFNDAHPSFHHRCIGGYSPAKMQRYQDLIEKYISPEINSIIKTVNSCATIEEVGERLPATPVISALNGKYIVIGEDFPPVVNHNALGNCWFISSAVAAHTPDEEIAALKNTDLRNTAIIGDDFAEAREKIDSLSRLARTDIAPADSIWMTHYAANELRYRYRSREEQAAVFSEVYYPEGWKAWIEPAGKYGEVVNGHYRPTAEAREIELFRTDWILRGAILPEGEHEIVMRYEPESYTLGARLSRISSITLILIFLISLGKAFFRKEARKENIQA